MRSAVRLWWLAAALTISGCGQDQTNSIVDIAGVDLNGIDLSALSTLDFSTGVVQDMSATVDVQDMSATVVQDMSASIDDLAQADQSVSSIVDMRLVVVGGSDLAEVDAASKECGDLGVCPAGQECVGGQCECTQNSCAGCCNGVTCIGGNSPALCGAAGDTCRGCPSNNSCNAGSCACNDGGCGGAIYCSTTDPGACTGYESPAGPAIGYDPCGTTYACDNVHSFNCYVTSTTKAPDGTPCDDDQPCSYAYKCTSDSDCSSQNSKFTVCQCRTGSSPCVPANSGICTVASKLCTNNSDCASNQCYCQTTGLFGDCPLDQGKQTGICANCTNNSDCPGNLCICTSGLAAPCDPAQSGICSCNGGPNGFGGIIAATGLLVPGNCNNVCTGGRCRSAFTAGKCQ